ncbi:glycoside hydrolase family 2 protein [Lacibacter sp.]|uniref:glycoside hydrolase family 2 protein n=1 Tax=Lacibacter sp. TaxID=1915409 RepID=UPI002B4ABC78|nr:sugar-binding domain-containing protein [Lacibacter sp.]HLP38184.1 glycoside hydrolase family 2 TIM barrel-domain containing protein [Lacibacter sp.]
MIVARQLNIGLIAIFATLLLCTNEAAFGQQHDPFAEIGNKAAATRTHLLITPKPEILPNIILPIAKSNRGFKPLDKMDTQEELQQELQKMRKQYEPFLKNIAPQIQNKRISFSLEKFDWRIETAADRRDFLNVVNGKGQWQSVSIPHYGPPIGKAVTYYRTNLNLPTEAFAKDALYIVFKAVDYKAHVFINGSYIGSHEGAFAAFEFDITAHAHAGENILLIKVENDYPMMGHVGDDGRKFDGDKVYAATGLGYDDPALGWHHNPPGMGIYQDVFVETRSSLHINNVFVRPIRDTDTAEVWLEINNTETSNRKIKIKHSLYGKNFQQTVYADAVYEPVTVHVPGVGDLVKPSDWERKQMLMGKGVNFLRFQIHVPKSRRWNPDNPWLYQLQVCLQNENGEITDVAVQNFGMRSFYMDTLHSPKGAMYLNGNFIRLHGANTMGSFMRAAKEKNWRQLIDDILLAKIAGMNYIRMTQFPVQQEVYDYCDQLGLMTQSDLPLFGVLRRNQWSECIRQVVELERHVRSHPSNIIISYINERFPNAEGNPQRHLDSYEDFERFFTAADQAVLLQNPDQVIKAGDGDYDPPSPGLPDNHVYNGWYNGHGLGLGEMYKGYWLPVKPGWYYACGEFGSEGLDFYNTMQQYYPKNWLPASGTDEKNWTPNVIAMSQTYRFHYMWFNRQHSVQSWIKESQEHQAWVTKLTTESFRRNNSIVSFAIHLFIDSWPAGWMKSIMDVNRQAKKAYFAYRHALAPLAVSLRSDRNQFFSGEEISIEAWIANDKNEIPASYQLQFQWENGNQVIASGKADSKIVSNGSSFQGFIKMQAPEVNRRTHYTLRIQIVNEKGIAFHENEFEVDVFPVTANSEKKVWVSGGANGTGVQLTEQLGLTVVADPAKAAVLLIDSINVYVQKKEFFDSLVQAGKTILFLEPPAGQHLLVRDTVLVSKTTMGQYYFASPVLTNPRMKSFKARDFFFWYNGVVEHVRPFLSEMSLVKGWEPLLLTGQTGWVGNNNYAFAAAEKKIGRGMSRICHIQLINRVQFSPVAKQFAMMLFQSNSTNK